MDGMNMQASFNNLTQMDKVQQDRHQLPIVNQVQNGEIAKQEAASKIDKANELEGLEGKIVDPKRKKEEEQRKKKKSRKRRRDGDSGHFVDFSV